MGTAWCCYTWLCVQHGSRCSKVRWQRGSQSWGELRDSSLRLQVCSLCHGSREAPNTTDECSEDWAAECVTFPAQVIFCMQILSRHDLKALADWKSSRTECSGSANCDVDARRRCSTSFTPSTVPTLFDFSLTHSLTHSPTHKSQDAEKLSPHECGFKPPGSARLYSQSYSFLCHFYSAVQRAHHVCKGQWHRALSSSQA